jgi:hypothetical protein
MDASSFVPALVGLAGAAIGGLTSFVTSWLTQKTQLREHGLETARRQRERLFVDFINEASRLYGDALSHEKEDVADLVRLYALVAHLRLVSTARVVIAAERTIDGIIDTYQGPKRTLMELREFAADGGIDPMRELGRACRAELSGMQSTTLAPLASEEESQLSERGLV